MTRTPKKAFDCLAVWLFEGNHMANVNELRRFVAKLGLFLGPLDRIPGPPSACVVTLPGTRLKGSRLTESYSQNSLFVIS
jgi:hypothetical protein